MVECLVQHLVPQSIFLEMIDNIVSVYHIGYDVLKYIYIVEWLNATNEMHHFSLERERERALSFAFSRIQYIFISYCELTIQ